MTQGLYRNPDRHTLYHIPQRGAGRQTCNVYAPSGIDKKQNER